MKLSKTMKKALDSLYRHEQRFPDSRRATTPSARDSAGRTIDGDRMGSALVKRGLAYGVDCDGNPAADARHTRGYKLTDEGRKLAADRAAARDARKAAQNAAREAFDAKHDVYLVQTEVVVSVPVAVAAADEAEAAAMAMVGKGEQLVAMSEAEVVARGVRGLRKAPEVKPHKLDTRFVRHVFVSLTDFDGHCDESEVTSCAS